METFAFRYSAAHDANLSGRCGWSTNSFNFDRPRLSSVKGHHIFGSDPFQMNGPGRGNAAVHKAAGEGQPVAQEIALSVKGDRVELRRSSLVFSRRNCDVDVQLRVNQQLRIFL